jgi:hypothetical protein
MLVEKCQATFPNSMRPPVRKFINLARSLGGGYAFKASSVTVQPIRSARNWTLRTCVVTVDDGGDEMIVIAVINRDNTVESLTTSTHKFNSKRRTLPILFLSLHSPEQNLVVVTDVS